MDFGFKIMEDDKTGVTSKIMAKNNRNNEKQVWVDGEFADKLEKLQARKRLMGKKVSMKQLTKEMMNTKSWEELEKEILELDKQATRTTMKVGIKFDGDFL